MQITPDIVLNSRKTIQVDRAGEKLDIDIPESLVPQMLKGKGRIEPRFPFSPFIVSGFGKESPGKLAGMQVNDELVGIDGNKFEWYDEFQAYLAENKTRDVALNILREGVIIDIPVKPTSAGLLGVTTSRSLDSFFELKTIKYGLLESIPAGISKGFKTIGDYLKQQAIFKRRKKG